MTTTTTTTAASVNPNDFIDEDAVRAQLLGIEDELNARFVNRTAESRGIVLAALAREHVLLLGPAGTGKSAMAGAFAKCLHGATHFDTLLTRFSSPEDLFGPVSLSGMKNDTHERVTHGMFPECHVAFLDEIFKANSAILNALLTAINERKFRNGVNSNSIPLEMVIGASNELPDDESLAAFHDRFLMRYWVEYVDGEDDFVDMLLGDVSSSRGASMTMDELHAAQTYAARVNVSRATAKDLYQLRAAMRKEGIVASDRRWQKVLKVLRASAWLAGDSEVTTELFPIIGDMVWSTRKEIEPARALASKYASAEVAEAQSIFEAIMGLAGNMPEKNDDSYPTRAGSVVREMKRAEERLQSIADGVASESTKAKVLRFRSDILAEHKAIAQAAREALGL